MKRRSSVGSARENGRKPLTHDGNAPALIIGPRDSSRSVAVSCNQLLNAGGGARSYLVIDPKGEIAAIASRRRHKKGYVKILNPFSVLVDQSDGRNPLEDIPENNDK